MARREPTPGQDQTRREFFRTFTREAVQNAGAVAGAAAELRRTSLVAARGLLDIESAPAAPDEPARAPIATPIDTPVDATFRSAYRFTDEAIVVLDQRELPGRVITAELHEASDVASAMRSGAITPGPVLGQVAAYGIALAAAGSVERATQSREQVIHAAAGTLRASRREVHAVRWAIDRMIGRFDELANSDAQGTDFQSGLKAEADQIATEVTAACAEVGRLWSELLVGDPVNVLAHGDAGPLACGMVGMTTSGLRALIDAGKRVHVWVTEGAPAGEGSRITALQLAQLDVPHTVVPDNAVAWLFANRRLDAVVLRGDTVASYGDSAATLGSLAIAQLASDAGVPVHVLAPECAWDREHADLSELVLDLRSAAELGSARRARLNPPFDIVPARVIIAYITERGVLEPPFKEPRG
jgi:methylthioribose-1-phosphate isomerase